MAYTTINKPSDYFNTVLYTGNGSTQSITGVGFKPDWVWAKTRVAVSSHKLYDSVRGVSKALYSNGTTAEVNDSPYGVTSFNSDGFSVNDNSNGDYGVNGGSGGTYSGTPPNYVAWNWLAGGTGVSNTQGSIASTVSANTTAGFSIVSYTGTGANATVGHGLGSPPKVIIIKGLSTTYDWVYGGDNIGWTKYLNLNNTSTGGAVSAVWNDTAPTSSVFSLGSNTAVNQNTISHIAYCFAEKKGFSKFGSYTGNGSTDGTFVYTGFKPAFVIIKAATYIGQGWGMYDVKRSTYNVTNTLVKANESSVEATSSTYDIDILSNGFKCRSTWDSNNRSGETYIYMAFAENPIVTSTKLPATAR